MLFYVIKCRTRDDGAVIVRSEDSIAAAIATVARIEVEVFTVSDGGPAQFHSSQLPPR